MKKTLVERFWSKVDKRGPDDCWEWTAYKAKNGYGTITYDGKKRLAHRVSVYLATGECPPADKCVCHTCNNPSCVNPAHLYVGTMQDNINDRERACRGNPARGEKQGSAKLNDKKVRAIREIYALGNITCRQLARLYDVSASTIAYIIKNSTWQHV